jgi:hypothetical protein
LVYEKMVSVGLFSFSYVLSLFFGDFRVSTQKSIFQGKQQYNCYL